MRPNLMSPRRASTSGEDSILAMLEREPARKRGGASNARFAWYGAGVAVAVALTSSLVWLAANNDGAGRDLSDTVLAEAVQALPPPAPPAANGASSMQPDGAAQVSEGASAALHQVAMATPALEAAPASPALIVDQPPPADAVPPLRLLKPSPAKAAPAPVREPMPAAKPPARTAVKATPAPRPVSPTPSVAKAPSRPAATAARPRPVLAAKSPAKPAAQPKAQRGVVPGKAADAGVDADVALISAVIVHANGHAPEGSQMTELLCPNDSCQARPSRQ